MSKTDENPEAIAKEIGIFWTAKSNWRISMKSDGDQFLATINAGIDCETFLTVGNSTVNYAWIEPWMIPFLENALDLDWKSKTELNLYEMIPTLLDLCRVADITYNNLLFSEEWKKHHKDDND